MMTKRKLRFWLVLGLTVVAFSATVVGIIMMAYGDYSTLAWAITLGGLTTCAFCVGLQPS